jgi:hypothetical protein
LETFDEAPNLDRVVRIVPQKSHSEVLDFPCVVYGYCSIACWSKISLGGSIEIQLPKTWGGGTSKRWSIEMEGGRIGENKRGLWGDCLLGSEYVGFWRGIREILLSPSLNLNCFPNACCSIVPYIGEARGLKVEYLSVYLFPKLPNNKTWHKLPDYV